MNIAGLRVPARFGLGATPARGNNVAAGRANVLMLETTDDVLVIFTLETTEKLERDDQADNANA